MTIAIVSLKESVYRSHKVRARAISKSRLQSRYEFKINEGRTDRVCSAYDRTPRKITPMVKMALAATEALVLTADGRAQRAV